MHSVIQTIFIIDIGEFDESLGHLSDWDWIMRTSEEAQIYSIPVLFQIFTAKRILSTDNTKQLMIYYEKNKLKSKITMN